MKKQLIHYFSLLSFLLLLGSCVSSKKIEYFQDTEDQALDTSVTLVDPQIQIGDLININITATNAEAALPFNLYSTPMVGTTGAREPLPYLVDTDGKINFPVLGKLEIVGLTTKELTKKLEALLVGYISDPVINIRFANFRISVLGEVNRPGAYPILNEHMSVVEAISLAGDLTIYGKRDAILLIRTVNGEKKQVYLDLTKKDILDSPYYYLKQNDIVYVVPNKTKVNASAVGPNTSVIFSSISILLAVVGLLL